MGKIVEALRQGSRSKRTATAGVLLAIASICTGLAFTIDVDPETQADWNMVAVAVIAAITAVSSWLSKDETDDAPQPVPEPEPRKYGKM